MERWKRLQQQFSSPQKSIEQSFDQAKTSMSSLVSRMLSSPDSPKPQRPRRETFITLDLDISHSGVRARIVVKRHELFSATLGEVIPESTEFSVRRYAEQLIVKYIDYATLTITHSTVEGAPDSHRYDIEWRIAATSTASPVLQDSLSTHNQHWFAGCMSSDRPWPLGSGSTWEHKLAPYVSWDVSYDPGGGYGGTLERYWLATSGVAVYVDSEVPLFVATDSDGAKAITFVAKFERPYKNLFEYNLFLKYSVFQSENVKTTHDLVSKEYFLKTEGVPNALLFEKPMWSTSHIGADISDQKVLEYVEGIKEHGFESSLLEFADDWTAAYGDTAFDIKRFPDIKSTLSTIKNKGFKVLLWVHPFASPRSSAFYEGQDRWVKSAMVEGVTAWTHGPAKLLDVTNPDSRTWFKKQLLDLKEQYQIDGFNLDAGTVNYLPALSNTYDPLTNPNTFTRHWMSLAADLCYEDNLGLVHAGVGTQNLPVMLSLYERKHSWGWDNGLKTLIPGVLSMGLMGYRYVLPGTVGGMNLSKGETDRELYVRWLETVLFMPAIKFSLPPWYLGDETLDIVKNLMKLRQSMTSYVLRVAEESKESGAPMVRPLWWRYPEDSIAVTVDSQFMLGEELIVAPVLEKGMLNRSIYLPEGVWKDGLRGNSITGPKWLYSYRASLEELPHFTLMMDDTSAEKLDLNQ